ncbi:MAG: hypothetical protein JNK00_01780 [Flavipsychrobacter sp.]|nr:hypothetical protein [Flavipsychrobacter sp.]
MIGMVFRDWDNGNYWSSTASNTNTAMVLTYDEHTYSSAAGTPGKRGQVYNCGCMKD